MRRLRLYLGQCILIIFFKINGGDTNMSVPQNALLTKNVYIKIQYAMQLELCRERECHKCCAQIVFKGFQSITQMLQFVQGFLT